MEVQVYYIAKDGTRFDDALKCQEYEAQLGTATGSVGRAKVDLKKIGEDKFIHGLLKVWHKGKGNYFTYTTRCIDDWLESYVNVDGLEEGSRYIQHKIRGVIIDLGRFDDDDYCEYEFIYSDSLDFRTGGFGCVRTTNNKFWEEAMKENDKEAK